jgi:hypothetical protein
MDTPTLVWFFLSNDELCLPMNSNWERPAAFEAGHNVKNASPRQYSPAGQQAILTSWLLVCAVLETLRQRKS